MRTVSQVTSASQATLTNKHLTRTGLASLPYSPLDVTCPRCRAYEGRKCVTPRGNRLRYPHIERTELSASEYRSAVRLQILSRIRGLVPIEDEEFGPLRLGGRDGAALGDSCARL